MLDLSLPPPAIIRAEPWRAEADRRLAELGLSRSIRRAILAELSRLVGATSPIIRASAEDLARYAKSGLSGDDLAPLVAMPTMVAAGGRALLPRSLLPFAVTYLGETHNSNNSDTSFSQSYSFGPVPHGANRRFLLAAVGTTGGAPSGCTLAGVTGVSILSAGSGISNFAFYIAEAPISAGTSGTVSGTMASGCSWAVGVWSIMNPGTATHPTTPGTFLSSATDTSPSTDDLDLDLTILPGQAALGFCTAHSGGTAFTWTGLTESFDVVTNAGQNPKTGATGVATGAPLAIKCTLNAGPTTMVGGAAVWGP